MRKYLILVSILLFSLTYAQVTHKVTIKEKINDNQFIIKIELNNLSNDSYIIPIDTTGFKAFYPDEMCGLFNTEYPYKYFSPTILIQNSKSKENLEGYARTYDLPETSIPKIEKHIDSSLQKRKILISDWAIKENIKNIKIAEKNFYLMKHLMILKPKESLIYETHLDIFNIKRSEFSLNFDSYLISPNNEYEFSSIVCIDRKVYNYLTKSQKRKLNLKNYRLFTGKIESNKIAIK